MEKKEEKIKALFEKRERIERAIKNIDNFALIKYEYEKLGLSDVDEIEFHYGAIIEENKRLREVAQKLLDWNTKYPPGKIYGYGNAKVMESELQEVVSDTEQILYDIDTKKAEQILSK